MSAVGYPRSRARLYQLMHAAPALLAACEGAVRQMEQDDRTLHRRESDALRICRLALGRAQSDRYSVELPTSPAEAFPAEDVSEH